MTLERFFEEHPVVAIGLSGGVDSTYLLYEAAKHCERCLAYFVKTPFQPAFELDDARCVAEAVGADMRVIDEDVLQDPVIAENQADRCYHCKRRIFGAIADAARADGISTLIDGTNASDDEGDRPGMRALKELDVVSPLRVCGITKDMIRDRARALGSPVWDKPSYACLATRFPTGTKITRDALARVEGGEGELFRLGYSDLRVRVIDLSQPDQTEPQYVARLQFTASDIDRAAASHADIRRTLAPHFKTVLLDLEPRHPRP